jgi:hypothetical protein
MSSESSPGRGVPSATAATTSAALRSASDSLLAALDELHHLEDVKRQEEPGSDRFVELARQIRDLATEVLIASNSQEHLAEAAADVAEVRPDIAEDMSPIAETRPPRELRRVLDEWRDAERRLAAAEAGSEAALLAQADARRLRLEYRLAHEAALQTHEGD